MPFRAIIYTNRLTNAQHRTRLQKRDSPTGGIAWGSEKIRGVNIGGWLVLEPWITPSIFQQYNNSKGIVDEYTLGQVLGAQAAHDNVLKPHWDSWVALGDFQKIANSGFNVVRIPIGFWAFDNANTPYASGAAPYLDTAIGWARQVGVKVVGSIWSLCVTVIRVRSWETWIKSY